MQIRPTHVIHAVIACMFGAMGYLAAGIMAALFVEYSRGPGGGYRYDLNDSLTKLYIQGFGLLLAVGVALVYWIVAVQLSKLLWRVVDRRTRRRRRGQCEKCAYPIGVSPVCTECGAAVVRDSETASG